MVFRTIAANRYVFALHFHEFQRSHPDERASWARVCVQLNLQKWLFSRVTKLPNSRQVCIGGSTGSAIEKLSPEEVSSGKDSCVRGRTLSAT